LTVYYTLRYAVYKSGKIGMSMALYFATVNDLL